MTFLYLLLLFEFMRYEMSRCCSVVVTFRHHLTLLCMLTLIDGHYDRCIITWNMTYRLYKYVNFHKYDYSGIRK